MILHSSFGVRCIVVLADLRERIREHRRSLLECYSVLGRPIFVV